MRCIIFSIMISFFIVSCNREEKFESSQQLRHEILDLQKDVRRLSNEIAMLMSQGHEYKDEDVQIKIDQFVETRTLQSSKVNVLKEACGETVDYELVVCGDFESKECFVDNWDVRKGDGRKVEITQACSYNGSSSLRLSTPFDENEFNISGIEIEGYINGIEAKTIYKVRFWMRYSGTSDLSNGPLVHAIIIQDGEWLDYLYEGSHNVNENKEVDKDWALYSFQIATKTDSPLEFILGSNLEEVCIDDVHIVKKG